MKFLPIVFILSVPLSLGACGSGKSSGNKSTAVSSTSSSSNSSSTSSSSSAASSSSSNSSSNSTTSSSGSSSASSSTSSSSSSGSGASSSSSSGSSVLPSAFVGVWDGSTDEGADGFDEIYVVLSADGIVSIYDYAGDTYDARGNCYWINEKSAKLTSAGGSKYISALIDPSLPADNLELDIVVAGDNLTVKSIDIDDADDDGNTSELYIEYYKRSNRSVASFTPECTGSLAAARAVNPTTPRNAIMRLAPSKTF